MAPRPFTASMLFVPFAILASAAMPATARADQVYWSTEALLKDFFKTSERVTYVRVDADHAADEMKAVTKGAPKKPSYVVFVAKTGANIDGYAVIDEQPGEHLPITFGVKVSPDGAVERMEVMVYREGYGGEVHEPRFRQQFVGKQAADPIRPGEDVVAISGATISSKAIAAGVRRALLLVSIVKKHALDGGRETAQR